VEDWHAAPNNRISNAELMRATASITRHVRELRGVDHRSSPALTRGAPAGIGPATGVRAPARRTGGARVAFDAVAALIAPDRPLPDGRQLRELAPTPEQLAAYSDHVHGLCRRWAALADQAGTTTSLQLLADYAAVSCRRWWLGLDWPCLVTEFLARLEDPTRWSSPSIVAHVRHLAPPSQAANLDDLRMLLLAGPDRMDAETADYCLRAGIGGLLPKDYHRPPRPRHNLLDAVLPLISP
jgi:hypothetical protein